MTERKYATYENKVNKHITIHTYECTQINKNGGKGKGSNKQFYTLQEAKDYANKFSKQNGNCPVIMCSFCNPK